MPHTRLLGMPLAVTSTLAARRRHPRHETGSLDDDVGVAAQPQALMAPSTRYLKRQRRPPLWRREYCFCQHLGYVYQKNPRSPKRIPPVLKLSMNHAERGRRRTAVDPENGGADGTRTRDPRRDRPVF